MKLFLRVLPVALALLLPSFAFAEGAKAPSKARSAGAAQTKVIKKGKIKMKAKAPKKVVKAPKVKAVKKPKAPVSPAPKT